MSPVQLNLAPLFPITWLWIVLIFPSSPSLGSSVVPQARAHQQAFTFEPTVQAPTLDLDLHMKVAHFAPESSIAFLLVPPPVESGSAWVMEEVATDDFMDELDSEFSDNSQETSDPLEGYNRMMTDFNDWFYLSILHPVASGWHWVAPEGLRTSLYRFFRNLLYPIRLVNNLLQAKPLGMMEETGRFVVNSTIGLLGLFDPAKAWFGWQAHDEDFGQTLGYWGVPAGPHIVLPLLGPSNLRDTFALAPDWQLNPIITYAHPYSLQLGILSLKQVDETSLDLKGYESIKKDAVDLYPFLRDLYEQNRNKKIKE